MMPRSVLARGQAAVRERAQSRCEVCGLGVTPDDSQVHHRRPRGSGGSSNPAIHSPANLLLVCLPCHAWIESYRNDARAAGYLVPLNSRAVPARVPVAYAGRGWLYLLDDGTVMDALDRSDH